MSTSPRLTRYSSLPLKEVVSLCAGPCDDEAWEEFICRVGKPISLVVTRTASLWGEHSRYLVEDLIQVTFLKLWEGGRQLLRDFAVQRPDAILGYVKKMAVNATHDYFKHGHNQTSGRDRPHVSTSDVDPEAADGVHGSQQRIALLVFLNEVDEHLKGCLTGPDQERDHMIFWLYTSVASGPRLRTGHRRIPSYRRPHPRLWREYLRNTQAGGAQGSGMVFEIMH